jgi:hypothetical protein
VNPSLKQLRGLFHKRSDSVVAGLITGGDNFHYGYHFVAVDVPYRNAALLAAVELHVGFAR